MDYSLALNGKRDKAQKYYEKTLEIDRDNVAALNANILLDQGKEDEALNV
jgi:tetratricopeptide (TPR) repeat protein